MEKLGIYSRVSKDKNGLDRSLPTQEEDGSVFAKDQGWSYELYTEKEGTSGTKEVDERPELWRLLNDVKECRVTAIYAYDISRLERNENDRYLIFKTLNDSNAKLYTKRDGFVDFTRPEIKLQLDILSATNNYMVALTKAKVKDTLTKNIRDKRNHGIPTYGYLSGHNKKLEIHPENSEVVKRVFEMCLAGNGGNTIAKTLSDEGIPTPSNYSGGETLKYKTKNLKKKVEVDKKFLKWNPVTINRILNNPQYKGERHWGGKVYPVDPIVSVETWDKAQIAIAKNKNNGVNNTPNNYLLAGKIICGVCGHNYHGYTHAKRGVHVYMCGLGKSHNKGEMKCGNKRIDQYVIEDILWQRVIGNSLLIKVLQKEFNFDDMAISENHQSAIDRLVKELERLNSGRKKLISMVAKGDINEVELQEQMPQIRKEIAETEKKLKELQAKQEVLNNKGEVLSEVAEFQAKYTNITNAPFELKRKLVEMFIDTVRVKFNKEDKLTELDIRLKINLEYHALDEEIHVDLKKLKEPKKKKVQAYNTAKSFLRNKKSLGNNIVGGKSNTLALVNKKALTYNINDSTGYTTFT